MTPSNGDRIVAAYIARLESALAAAPSDRREEIVGEIRSHIAEARTGLASETEADVRNLLERVGDPAEIAAAAQDRTATSTRPARTWGALEVAALILTPFIWPVGVILLWLSPSWNVRDKLIGTLLPPGGYFTILVLGPVFAFATVSTCTTASDDAGTVIYQSCTGVGALPQWQQTLISIGTVSGTILLLVLPVVVAIYLAIQLRRGANATLRAQNHPPDAGAAWSDRTATVP